MITQYLDTNGDGTGTKNAIGNYSGGAEVFYIAPPANQSYSLARIIPHLRDVGAFDADKYGNNITLTNGVILRISDDSGVKQDLTDGLPILTNADWARQCYDIDLSTFGTGNEFLHARWTFSKSGAPLLLNGANGDKLEIVLEDDYSGLVEHYFLVQGVITAANE